MHMDPKVSVIVAAYGQEEVLSEALDSLINQSYRNWEAIITDDGSTDNVAEVARRYVAKDSRIKFIHSDNRGLAATRNLAVESAAGEYLLMLDGDDRIHPRYLEECVDVLEKRPDVKTVLAFMEAFGSESYLDRVAYRGYKSLLINNSLYVTAMMRRNDFVKAGGFDERFRRGLEDWEFWIRFLPEDNDEAVYVIPEVRFYYRKKEDSMLSNIKSVKEKQDFYRNLLFEKHKEKYHKYFGSDIREWMLMDRLFSIEVRFLLRDCYQPKVLDKDTLHALRQVFIDIANDKLLAFDRKEYYLNVLLLKWRDRIEASAKYLSIGKKVRFQLLKKSVKGYIRFTIWRLRNKKK